MKTSHTWSKARTLGLAAAVIAGVAVAGPLSTAEPAHAQHGGTVVNEGKYPFYTDVPGCGGALVATTWVLTASHCSHDLIPGSSSVAVNTFNYSDRAREIRSTVRQVVQSGPDAALVKIDPVTSIRPIRLVDTFIPEGWTVANVGMGVGSEGRLREASFTVIQQNPDRSSVTLSNSNHAISNDRGDSGSPFFVWVNGEPRLVGVTSVVTWMSDGSVRTDVTNVASNPALRDWFSRTTGLSVPPLNKTVSIRSSNGGLVSERLDYTGHPANAWPARQYLSDWEKFDLIHNSDGTVSFRSRPEGLLLTANPNGSRVVTERDWVGTWERFSPVYNPNGTMSFRAVSNGKYLTVDTSDDWMLKAIGTLGAPGTQFTLTTV